MAAVMKEADDYVKRIHAAKKDVLEKIAKLSPEERATEIRRILAGGGRKIEKIKWDSAIKHWESLDPKTVIRRGKKHFREASVEAGKGGIEEMFEYTIKLPPRVKQLIKKINQQTLKQMRQTEAFLERMLKGVRNEVGRARLREIKKMIAEVKERAKKLLDQKSCRIDHVWVSHNPDGKSGLVIIYDLTGSLNWGHLYKTNIYREILKKEIAKVIPEAAQGGYQVKAYEHYWRD